MKGSETKLVSYMQGSDKRFIIPVYQRNYDWRRENCIQLFDDLIKVIRRNRSSHFFGSIVSVHNDGEFNEYLIIDGQQRLTTVSLLMLAMYNLMKEGRIVPAQSNLADKIYRTYLIDEWQEGETRIKLKPVKNDSAAYGNLISSREPIQGSNLTVNYRYFYDRIQKGELTIDELYTAITKLEIINITLGMDDNPQLIFESLNSTGVALSEGDKIRNYILMGLQPREQNRFYEQYWNRIEVCTCYDVSSFIRDYLSLKQLSIPVISRVYSAFKEYVEECQIGTEPLLQDLLAYAKRYEILLRGNTPDKVLNACIYRLNRLETTVTRPFFLEVLRMREEDVVSHADLREIFLLTENYLFRRSICSIPTNALNKIFLMMHREIIRYDGTSSQYLEKFKYALLSKTDNARFPDDDEFIQAFSTRPVYQMNMKNKLYILERFENFGTLEDKDIYRHCNDGTYSIEHIMPQHLTPTWIADLGEDYEAIHETWLHRIANLTLTAYNSKYSNSPFREKVTMENGFADSGLRMNIWIAQQPRWTLAELEERSGWLMERALTIWAAPQTAYQPAEKQMDFCTLDDDVDLSGRDIARFAYQKTEQPVTSWIVMMEQVLKMLHQADPSVLSRLTHADNPDSELSPYVSSDPGALRSALQIDTDIFVERNTSTNTKLMLLKKFFRAYGLNPEDLVFYLRDSSESAQDDAEPARYDLRKKFWGQALAAIKEANADRGIFRNVNPTKGYWISGSFGIGGFSIMCEAQMKKAGVDLCLGQADTARNKSAFDYLQTQKDSIEQKLGCSLLWYRLDDKKASYVVIHLDGVSITDESDWPRITQFLAEWSKRFYDVFVPLLRDWSRNQGGLMP